MLRYSADRRTLAYMVVTTALFAYQWTLDSINPLLYFVFMFLSVAVTVIAHNHNHVPIWRSKVLNGLTDYWLTVFYGFPAFGWIPTHNMNHHSLNNKEGDYTITYRFTEQNHLLMLLSYPTVSSYYQQKPIRDYLKMQKQTDRGYYWFSLSQYVVLVAWVAGAFALAWNHPVHSIGDFFTGLIFNKALYYVIIPQQFGLFSVLVFNYVQHVHADEESEIDHSRNFTSWSLNAFLFNNGYHTVHHERAGVHWSKNKEAHAKVADKIDPVLNEKSFWGYIFRVYFLGAIIPKFRTKSKRLARMARQKSNGGRTGADEKLSAQAVLAS